MKMQTSLKKALLVLLLSCAGLTITCAQKVKSNGKPVVKASRWSVQKADRWYSAHKFIVGCDFIPSTAVNQLEMWQAATFDAQTIDQELGWAQGIGFNTVRVYLHSLAYGQDPKGFKDRVGRFLSIAHQHNIQALFVFFDDCWNPNPKAGKQPDPKPGIHNSGWAQDPGRPITGSRDFTMLGNYVKDVMTTFAHDKRILLWDLYNEPGNSKKGNQSYVLLTKVFAWAREVNPDQPISAGLWAWDLDKLNAFQALNSDVITYHQYEDPDRHWRTLHMLKSHGRPLICTEYMARRNNSRFANILPMLKKENVGAINWGFVAGKTNTIYAWDTPLADGSEPKEWFHDILKKDGTPYKTAEIDAIKKVTGKQ